ncbi:MAG: metallophosphoesterase [Gemmataceae bacterium]
MDRGNLVQDLFEGPIDIVGDVHGEFQAFQTLLALLGYDGQGRHTEGRRLVFVGDLGDRGEDSPGVIDWICERVQEQRAQAVLGNHELNALDAAAGGPMKTELSWLFDEARPYSHHGHRVPQVAARGQRRENILQFFASLPVALERPGELPVRVVHACWEASMVNRIRHRRDALAVFHEEHRGLDQAFHHVGGMDALARKLLHQNCNAIKRLTSGLEGRAARPIVVNEEQRWELRLPWWHDYRDPVLCVIGHYWRIALPGEVKYENLFDGLPLESVHGGGPVLCIDYSVGKRFRERFHRGYDGSFRSRLGALRLPEKVLFFDNAPSQPLLA